MKIELVDISSLVLDPENEREHPAENLKDIKNSLKLFGQQTPLNVSPEGVVLKGNGTLMAAKELGWTQVYISRTDLTAKKQKAYKIVDNRSGEKAKWRKDLLSKSLENLKTDFSLEELGFDDSWIKVPPVEGDIPDDEIPEQVETRCKPGDLWLLGEHRLLCGDSTDILAVELLMGGEKADLINTDPPYGVNYKHDSRPCDRPNKFKKIENDQSIEELPDFLAQIFSNYFLASSENAAFYVWHAYKSQTIFENALVKAGFKISQQIIWEKGHFAFGRQDYHWRHEPCFYGWKEKGKHSFYGDRNQSTVWNVLYDSGNKTAGHDTVHPTQKPIELGKKAIENNTTKGERVLDLFLGSGSTLIACEKTQRRCFGMELDPKYCDVILSRWEQFTGKKAVLSAGAITE